MKTQDVVVYHGNSQRPHIEKLSALTLEGVEARNYRKNPKDAQAQDLQLKKAA
jgi:hypothetical protein